ncbi:hypothetical protein ACF05W_34855 [Streptomyces lydicus]|uniref:hypothetical protein n=1 Tax=Streptomyces lydicus TaxID=47763 RepID=UPI00370191C8
MSTTCTNGCCRYPEPRPACSSTACPAPATGSGRAPTGPRCGSTARWHRDRPAAILDRAERACAGTVGRPARWNRYVRLLRRLVR